MSLPRKKLPLGLSTLANLISGGHYYVDKTALALQLIEQGSYYFLSRPSRFGKSLFLDTLKEIFEGNQALFTGLHIHDHWDWTRRHPVLRISFAGGVGNVAGLHGRIHRQLEEYERKFDLPARYPHHNSRFADLISRLHQQTGQRVVVLVDDYDKPVRSTLEDSALAAAMCDVLLNIYAVLKGSDAHLRFVFLTGVVKFARGNLFSGLNNLDDITLDPAYSAICGYTDAEVNTIFAPELPGLDREQMRHWYGGNNWGGESVYNPADLLLLFSKRRFQPWWHEVGTSTALTRLMAKDGFFTPELANLRTGRESIGTFDIDQIPPEALLFQMGYLTIQHCEQSLGGRWRYTLGYPNRDRAVGLNASLLTVYTGDFGKTCQNSLWLEKLLLANDVDGLRDLFQSFFASIPSIPITQCEGYYASVFYSYFAALGFEVRVEDATNQGRIAMAVKLPERIFLFEFKVVELVPIETSGHALQQLKEKAYADKYRAAGLPIVLVGVEFSRETRNVVGFESETQVA